MAAHSADFSVQVNVNSDPNENRPKDEQAIVLDIERDIPNLEYALELNKHVQDEKSFLYIYRISRDRLCVVLREASQAAMLVENVGRITVNNKTTEIKYLVPKAVKVNISNAGYGITNSALKRYLTTYCKIQTLSSVSEQKSNIDKSGVHFTDSRSSRRVVYINPYDVEKLPKGPIKFTTPAINTWVFFDVDSPKCHLCSNTGHFRKDCPRNVENSDLNASVNQDISQNSEKKPGVPAARVDNEESSEKTQTTTNVNKSDTQHEVSPQSLIPLTGAMDNTVSQEGAGLKFDYVGALKRARSPTSSTTSSSENQMINLSESPFKTPDASQEKKNYVKKRCLEKKNNEKDRISKLNLLLKPARDYIEKSHESHKLDFDQVVKLLAIERKTPLKERKELLSSITDNLSELESLLESVYGLVEGKGIKARITTLKRTINDADTANSDSDFSIYSDLETAPSSQEQT